MHTWSPNTIIKSTIFFQQYGDNSHFKIDLNKAILSINGQNIPVPFDLLSNLLIICTELSTCKNIKAYPTKLNKLDE